MVGKLVPATALAALLAVPVMAADDETEVLKRTGKWVVEYDRDACHIYSEFGVGDTNVVARITRYSPGDWFKFAVFGQRVRAKNVTEDVKIDFGLKGSPVTEQVLTGAADTMPALFFNSVRLDGWNDAGYRKKPTITPEQEAAVTGVTIAMRGKPPFRLDAGSFARPFQVMRDCLSNLVRSWGYDPEEQERLTRRPDPRSAPMRWITYEDYPSDALRKGQSGIVQFRLDVDAEGKVAGCYILDRTEPDAFATVTCRAFTRRARFAPALDAAGKPVRSYFVSSISFLAGY